MLEKLEEFFEGVRGAVISGVALLLSLILPKIIKTDIPMYLDPAWIAVIVSGIPLMVLAVKRIIKNRGISKISSALLISVAMIAAIVIGDLFAAGEVAFIMAIGEILEDKTTERARKGLKKLIEIQPKQARRVTGEPIAVEELKVGDLIRILPGEAIPADGEIVSGETSVDQSVITGESLPVDKAVGDSVFCGTVNRFGSIDVAVTSAPEDSSLQKLIRIVKEADEKQAPMQRVADKWASRLVPLAMVIAIIAGTVTMDVEVAVTVLVVFCPCALVLATPTAIMAAIGQATKHGIIIKSGEALEKLGEVDTVAFDKTGTLTTGKLSISDVVVLLDGIKKDALISIAASVESKSEHPLGRAIVEYAKDKNLHIAEISGFVMEAGKGVSAEISGKKVYCGNEKYIEENGFEVNGKKISKLKDEGKAVVIVATCGQVVGAIALSDTVKSDAKATLKRLKQLEVKPVLMTGDNKRTAEYFASEVGIKKVYSELLPENKLERILELQLDGKTVCMVGDGVNDAPALKKADVGIAMGTMGSDVAVEAADVALMNDDISKLPYLKRLAVATVKTIRLSISLSLIINLIAIILSVAKVLNPTTGALIHNAGSCFVVLIAALLYERKFD